MSNGLQIVQAAFAAQRARDMEDMQKSNKIILLVAGTLAAMGFLSLLVVTYLQWCMSKGLAEISAALPAALSMVHSAGLDTLGPPEQVTVPLLGEAQPHKQPRRGAGRSIERLLFPNPGDSLRRRQFRTLKVALLVGLIFAAAMALVLYLISRAPKT